MRPSLSPRLAEPKSLHRSVNGIASKRWSHSEMVEQPATTTMSTTTSLVGDNDVKSRVEKATSSFLNDIPVGSMDFQMWSQGRKLVLQWSSKKNVGAAQRALDVLDRLQAEATADSDKQFDLNATLYNAVLHAYAKRGDPIAAEKLFYQMKSEHLRDPTRVPAPDEISYNSLLHAWASSQHRSATEKVESLLTEMLEHPTVQPTTYSYNLVMLAYANQEDNNYGSAKAAEDWLLQLSKNNMESGVGPDTTSFNTVLKAWANSKDRLGPDRALEILNLMSKLHQEGHLNAQPDRISFLTVINAFAKQGRGEQAQNVLDMAHATLDEETERIIWCYNGVIKAWINSSSRHAGLMAEQVLEDARSRGITPDVVTISSCIAAHTNSNRPDAPERAEAFLRNFVGAYQRGETNVVPTTLLFNDVLKAWARTRRPDAGERAESLVEFMKTWGSSNPSSAQTTPDLYTYNLCVDAWTFSHVEGSTERLLQLVERMENHVDQSLLPDRFTYDSVIRKLQTSNKPAALQRTLSVLERMESLAKEGNLQAAPGIVTYNAVLRHLGNFGDRKSAQKALDILTMLEQEYEQGNEALEPGTITYSSVLHVLAQKPDQTSVRIGLELFRKLESMDQDPTRDVHLDFTAIKTILMLLSRAPSPTSADAAYDILDRMMKKGLRPDAGCLSLCVQAIAKTPGPKYIHRAHGMLKRFVAEFQQGKLDEFPHIASFTVTIRAWSLSKSTKAPDKTFELLHLLEELKESGARGAQLNSTIYSAVLSVLARSGDPKQAERAESMLRSLGDNHERGPRPDQIMWNTVLLGWSRAACPDRSQRANQVLEAMKADPNVTPDEYSFNTVINAAVHTKGNEAEKLAALQIAVDTFEQMKKSPGVSPDHITYLSMMKAHTLLAPDKNVDELTALFEQCCESGHVSPSIMHQLKISLPETAKEERLAAYKANAHKKTLPTEWTRNVGDKKGVN